MVHRDERLFQTVHQSSELWLKLAVLRDRRGDRAARRRTRSAARCACSGAPTTACHRRPTPCTCSSGSRPGSTTRCARRSGTAAASTRRASASSGARAPPLWDGVRGAARRAAASRSPTSTCASLRAPDAVRPRRGADRARRAHVDLARRAREDGAARDRRRCDRHAGNPGRGARGPHEEPPLPGALGRAEHASRRSRTADIPSPLTRPRAVAILDQISGGEA